MTAALLATLLAVAPAGKAHQFPLAAALVQKDQLYLVDVPTRTAQPVPLDGLDPEEADLSQDKKLIAVNAKVKGGKGEQPFKLFLVKVGTWEREEIVTGAKGSHRFPRFSGDGNYLYFSAAQENAQGGPANPLRIHRLKLADRKVEEISTTEGNCELSPVPVGASAVAHITTGCMVRYELALTDLKKKTTKVLNSVNGPTTEIAASPDGKRVVWAGVGPTGLRFFLKDVDGAAKRIASAGYASEPRAQPRFICPRDLVFLNLGKVWALDTKMGTITEILVLPKS